MTLITVVTPAARRALTTVGRYRDTAPESELLDAQIEALIGQATARAESYCNRIFARERVIETFYVQCDAIFVLSRLPVITLHGITLDDVAMTTGDYRLEDAGAGIVRLARTSSALAALMEGPGTNGDYGWPTAPPASTKVAIDYTGGWLMPDATGFDVPADLEAATQNIARDLIERTTSIRLDVTSERLGDAAWTYGGASAAAGGSSGSQTFDVIIRPVLDRYRMAAI